MAEADYGSLPADTRAEPAYAAGVNAFLATRANQLPVQFQLAGVAPETWRPADSLAWFGLMSLSALATEARHCAGLVD
ncbi:acyl-homoserine lactone acylase PvdQ [Bradyrhizobium japonicum]